MDNRHIVGAAGQILPGDATIAEAMRRMTDSGITIVVANDAAGRMMGIAVDSDIRRALLRNPAMDQPIANALNREPMVAPVGLSRAQMVEMFSNTPHPFVPVVDGEGRIVELIATWALKSRHPKLPNVAVLMAGGRGQRLMPHTAETPKPMVEVGDQPILETIIRQVADAGISTIYLSVGYLAEKIKQHFGDGSSRGLNLRYIEETTPLGTAGAPAHLQSKHEDPILIINGDVLSRLPLERLIEFHSVQDVKATMVVRNLKIEIPYGVVNIENGRMASFVEKPTSHHFVNAGIYVLDPDILSLLREGEATDMPDLLLAAHDTFPGCVSCFAMPEYWQDIAHDADLQAARQEFSKEFGGT